MVIANTENSQLLMETMCEHEDIEKEIPQHSRTLYTVRYINVLHNLI